MRLGLARQGDADILTPARNIPILQFLFPQNGGDHFDAGVF
jgi:hypothetical protein